MSLDWSSKQVRDRFYQSLAWQQLRKMFLQRHPKCRICKAPATTVDHIVDIAEAPDMRLSMGNLQPFCSSCHSRKTGLSRRNKQRGSSALVYETDRYGIPTNPDHPWFMSDKPQEKSDE